jgi:Trk-type K+ transport system membrane component
MIAGRLELYTIILMFNPDAWRARKKHMAVQPDILK